MVWRERRDSGREWPGISPDFLIQRSMTGVVAAAASSAAYFHFFQKSRIRGVHLQVLIAGTATATPADATVEWRLFGPAGTTSFAGQFYSTNSVAHLMHATVTATVGPAGCVQARKLLDATGSVIVSLEYEVLPDAVMS